MEAMEGFSTYTEIRRVSLCSVPLVVDPDRHAPTMDLRSVNHFYTPLTFGAGVSKIYVQVSYNLCPGRYTNMQRGPQE